MVVVIHRPVILIKNYTIISSEITDNVDMDFINALIHHDEWSKWRLEN